MVRKKKCDLCKGYKMLIETPPIDIRYMPYGYRPKPFKCYRCNGTGKI